MPSAKDVLLGSDAARTVELLLNLLTDAASQRDVSAGVSDVIQVRACAREGLSRPARAA